MSLSLNYPTISPSLLLDFANSGRLDPQVTFTRSSTATFFDETGVLRTANNGVPRFDYNPATLAAQGLLIEELRTNLVTYSAEFDNAAWSKLGTNTTGTPAWVNVAAAPDGTTTADKIIDTAANELHYIVRTPTVTANTAYAWSVFVKASEYSRVQIRFGKSLTPFTRIGIIVNLNDGSITNSDVGTPTSVSVRSATPVGNGWYRIAVAGIFDTTSTDGHVEVALVDNSGNSVFAGTGTDGLFVWGAQLEAGVFPTSYIPTTTTALTRAADVASVDTLSPWYNAAEGTIYIESTRSTTTGFPGRIKFSDGTANNSIDLYYTAATNSSTYEIKTGGVQQAAIYGGGGTLNAVTKAAAAYKVNDAVVYYGGSLQGTDTSLTVPSGINQVRIGNALTGYILRIAFYPVCLPDAQLQAITA